MRATCSRHACALVVGRAVAHRSRETRRRRRWRGSAERPSSRFARANARSWTVAPLNSASDCGATIVASRRSHEISLPGLLSTSSSGSLKRAAMERVQRSPMAIFAARRGLIGRRHRAHDVPRLQGHLPVDLRKHGRPADARVQFAADGQHGVANLFGRQPPRGKIGQQFVAGVELGQVRKIGVFARLPKSLAGHDQPIQLLDAPAVIDEPHGQPVEQFGMRRPRAHLAKIVRRGHQPAAKMLLPDAVDDHPGGERIRGRSDPLRQRQPAAIGPGGNRVPGGRLLAIARAEGRARARRAKQFRPANRWLRL